MVFLASAVGFVAVVGCEATRPGRTPPHASADPVPATADTPNAAGTPDAADALDAEQAVRGHGVLTVAESKRLIAKAIARMPVVRAALRDGMVIVCKGTTNTYVAEELLGRPIPHGAYVYGRVTPRQGARPLPAAKPVPEVILVNGQHRPDLTLEAALLQVGSGDVIIKGGNALNHDSGTAAVWIGSSTGGTTAKILPHVGPGKAHLLVPIGLEKQIAGDVVATADAVNASVETIGRLGRMQVLPGTVVTELEALRLLAGVEVFQASAGGIAGAEGAVWLIWSGPREAVEKASLIVEDIQGEPPFGARPDGPSKESSVD